MAGLFSWNAIQKQTIAKQTGKRSESMDRIHETQLKYISLLCVRT